MSEYFFLGSAILSVANGAVLLWLNPRRNVNRAFFVSSLFIAGWASATALAILSGRTTTTEPNQTPLLWIRASLVAGALLGWSVWLMRTAILKESDSFQTVVGKSWPLLVISILAAVVGVSELYAPSTSTQQDRQRGIGFEIYNITAALSCIWMLYDGLRHQRTLNGARKIEMQLFVLGLVLACILLMLSNQLGTSTTLRGARLLAPLWFVFLHFFVVWTICSHRVFEARHLVSLLGYRIAVLCITGAGIAYIAARWTQPFASAPAIFAMAFAAGTIALIADPKIKRLLRVERAQLLEAPRRKIVDMAATISDEDQLRTKFTELLRDYCQTQKIEWLVLLGTLQEADGLSSSEANQLVRVVSEESWTTPQALRRRRPLLYESLSLLLRTGVGALIAAPRNSRSPSLVIMFGEKESLRPYSYTDIELLMELTELMDNLLVHSRATASAARAEKLAAAAIISRGLAHDLNNLATPVSTFLNHMNGRVAPYSPEGQVLADANNALRVMQCYIQDSLFFSRALIPQFVSVEVRLLIESVLRVSEVRASESGVRACGRSGPHIKFVADFAMMQRLLQNLVFNAIDASPPNGVVELCAEKGPGEQVLISVSDQGPGVPLELRDKIFEPYFTTKDTGTTKRGLGLGLAICRKIVELHHGEIVVKQNTPRGSVFVVIIPPLSVPSPTPQKIERSHAPKSSNHEIIEASSPH